MQYIPSNRTLTLSRNKTERKHSGKRRNSSQRGISSFPTVFSKGLTFLCSEDTQKPGLVWERVKAISSFR